MSGIVLIVYLAIVVLIIAGWWMIFTKAGEAGWKSIIPIWSSLVILRIAGHEWWWLILLLIPLVNIVVWFIVAIDLARNFGKGTGFGVGLAILSPIFAPILGFGDATYRGPTANAM